LHIVARWIQELLKELPPAFRDLVTEARSCQQTMPSLQDALIEIGDPLISLHRNDADPIYDLPGWAKHRRVKVHMVLRDPSRCDFFEVVQWMKGLLAELFHLWARHE
jgi:hypothetical protein